MAEPYDLVVFDWDGTLMNTTGLIARGIRHAAREMGVTVPTMAAANAIIGLEWRQAMGMIIPDLPVSDYEEFGRRYNAWYIPNEEQVFLFAGMREIVAALARRGVKTAVATGKSRKGLNRVLAKLAMTDMFVSTQTVTECAGKPDPQMLEMIGWETGVDKARTLMVGDSTHDMRLAANYGCDAAAMLGGASPEADLRAALPRVVCRSPAELAGFLRLDLPEAVFVEPAP